MGRNLEILRLAEYKLSPDMMVLGGKKDWEFWISVPDPFVLNAEKPPKLSGSGLFPRRTEHASVFEDGGNSCQSNKNPSDSFRRCMAPFIYWICALETGRARCTSRGESLLMKISGCTHSAIAGDA